MSLEDLCVWRKTAERPGSTTFADVKDRGHDGYRCIHECTGYDHACRFYTSTANLNVRREIRERYPALFPQEAQP